LTDQEFDLFTQYEGLTKELQRFKASFRGGGQRTRGAATPARRPTVHPEQARMDRVEAELRRLEPMVRRIIGKLDAANWDMSRVSDDEWDLYTRYEQQGMDLKRLKGMPLIDVDDMYVPAGAQHYFRRQSPGARNEGGTRLLAFKATPPKVTAFSSRQ
jgi:hypothetical protein